MSKATPGTQMRNTIPIIPVDLLVARAVALQISCGPIGLRFPMAQADLVGTGQLPPQSWALSRRRLGWGLQSS